MTNKVKPFYIRITEDMTPQMVQDAFDKCVDAGAIAFECVVNTSAKYAYKCDVDLQFGFFGVDYEVKTYLQNSLEYYGATAQEITLDQLDEWLGLELDWKPCVGDIVETHSGIGEVLAEAFVCGYSKWLVQFEDTYKAFDEKDLRKPETPEQKAERERLEAAYDLYLTRHINANVLYRYDEFLKNKGTLNGFLAIVDKTNYRKLD